MRNNQPITSHETVIPDNVFIYSRTDLKGQIVEANKAFSEISGFQQEEMIGEPHNMVRHPDMPEEAFSGMWRSLKAGKPWKGMVKNRRKDGGYYWVYATVSPVREEGKVIGFQSVRIKPSRQQIENADAIYRRLKEGDKSIRIVDGRALRNRSKLVEIALNPVFQVNATICLGVLTLLLGVASTGLDMPWSTALFQVLAGSTLFASGYLLLWALPRFFRRVSNIKGFLETLLNSGNLRTQLNSTKNDALGEIEALLDMQVSATRSIVQIMQDSAKNVNDTTNTLNSSVVSLTGSASRQTEKTNAAAATIEELISSIGLIAQQAVEIESASKEVGIRSAEGAQLSDKASETIKALSQTVTSSAERVE